MTQVRVADHVRRWVADIGKVIGWPTLRALIDELEAAETKR